MIIRRLVLLLAMLPLLMPPAAFAQIPAAGGPPAVGVVRVQKAPITETSEFVGRIEATDRVALVARVTAFLDQRLFIEGSEVKKGDLLYMLEQAPFQADLAAKAATVQQTQAQLANATLAFNRVASLLKTPAGQQSAVDDARATMLSDAAQVQNAEAHAAPIADQSGLHRNPRTDQRQDRPHRVTIGNVVSPSSGVLATIVSQDPMYVVFPVALRTALDLRDRYAKEGGFSAVVIKLRLANGHIYSQPGKLNFFDNTVSQTTDTITCAVRSPIHR